jgi:hypothetical protein
MNRCSFTSFSQTSSFSIVCLIPIVSLCGGWFRLTSIYSLVKAPAGVLNCWALFKNCVGVSHMYELFKLGVLFPCKRLLRIWSIGWEVFGETLIWWIPTRTTTIWPFIILGLPPLFLEMSVCRLLYHGISILICPNMLCAMSVDSACVRILWRLRHNSEFTNLIVQLSIFLIYLFVGPIGWAAMPGGWRPL